MCCHKNLRPHLRITLAIVRRTSTDVDAGGSEGVWREAAHLALCFRLGSRKRLGSREARIAPSRLSAGPASQATGRLTGRVGRAGEPSKSVLRPDATPNKVVTFSTHIITGSDSGIQSGRQAGVGVLAGPSSVWRSRTCLINRTKRRKVATPPFQGFS